MGGITQLTARQALEHGWTKPQLRHLHQLTSGWRQLELVPGGWAFRFLDGHKLLYRSYGLDEIRRAMAADEVPEAETQAYTDGSGTTLDKPAGIGVVVYHHHRAPELIAENIGKNTNNAAELSACWRALRVFPDTQSKILIKTDSEYAIGALTLDWARNSNAELITNIRQDLQYRQGFVRFEHVRGHEGHEGNEVADRLASAGRKLVTAVSRY